MGASAGAGAGEHVVGHVGYDVGAGVAGYLSVPTSKLEGSENRGRGDQPPFPRRRNTRNSTQLLRRNNILRIRKALNIIRDSLPRPRCGPGESVAAQGYDL